MDKRTKTDIIVIHCTQTPSDMDFGVEKVTSWHKNRGFDTIGYHYLIKRDGTLQVGRDEGGSVGEDEESFAFDGKIKKVRIKIN